MARAQAYPTRPVRLILPFGAGGVADVTSRLAADKLGDMLKQRFVVENMPGPGGIAAARAMITAAPDGYTLGLITNGTAISQAIYKQYPVRPGEGPCADLGARQFRAGVRDRRGLALQDAWPICSRRRARSRASSTSGTIAVGSTQHLGAELLRSLAKLDIQLIPYKTTPDVIVGTIRNDIQMMTDFYAAMNAVLSDKKLRPLATSGPKRSAFLPDVPTVAEAGVPGYEVLSWNGLGAPAATPQPILDTLNKAVREVLAMPDVIKRYADLGITAQASSPEELRKRLASEIKKWSDVIDSAKIPRL